MNNATNPSALPDLTADFLGKNIGPMDNLFADLWKSVGMAGLLYRSGFHKRAGVPINEVMFCLMLWVWVKVNSISMFSRESLGTFSMAGKDVLYEAMNREDWNWRGLHFKVARKAVLQMNSPASTTAFVLDDSIKIRHGKKMPGISSHFDHTTGRHVMGQQVLTLGLSCTEGFVPLDSELFISKVKAQGLPTPFADGRSIAAKRYRVALDQSKPEMAKAMIARAQAGGINADYLLADAWFGTKTMIKVAEDAHLISIVRMKKSRMKYRLSEVKEGKVTYRNLDLNGLYQAGVRCQWEKIPGQRYQAKKLDVEVNLNDPKDDTERWIKVRLLFVQGIVEGDKPEAGKHDWVVFLTTDTSLSPQRILEIYAMRWAIEVYFKEAKQHLGFLKEQATHYASYIASIHLCAIRFCLLAIAKLEHSVCNIAQTRHLISTNMTQIDCAAKLWQFFRALISGALDELKILLGDTADLIMETIELRIQRFFVQALQLDPLIMRLERS